MSNIAMNIKAFFSIIVFFLLIFSHQAQAQVKTASKVFIQKHYRSLKVSKLTANNFFEIEASKMGLSSASEMQWVKTIPGENGNQHFKFQQIYQSIPVFGSAYTIHEKNEIAIHASGYYLPMINIDIHPKIKPEAAIQAAKQSWMTTFKIANSFQKIPTPELVIIDHAYPQSSEQYALAFRVELYSSQPLDKRQYFVDAHTGKILMDFPLMMHQAVPARGVTKYYGTQSITIDSLSPNEFLLRDPTRNGNTTFNRIREVWSNTSNTWDLTNEDQDEVAMDAHYCTQEFHDLMLEKFDWNGLDNNGFPMNAVVHAGDFINAFWDGEFAIFGDGDCNYGPLTTLEVVGHEFMHGITEFTSGLIFSSESGAINESMSDVFGKALEYYTTPDEFNWVIGASFSEHPHAGHFRSFEDPNSIEHPKFYKGAFWEDNANVHINSSVGNHWFFNLVNGGVGVNEEGLPYDISGLGMDKATQVVFLTQKAYLTPNATYSFYAESSLLAAQELFGENALELESVIEAWKSVGLNNPIGEPADFLDLTVSFLIPLEQVCLNDEFYSTEVLVTNLGTMPYLPSFQGVLSVNGGVNNIQTFELENSILPGESFIYEVNNLIFFDQDTTEVISANLMLLDDNAQNNLAVNLIDNSMTLEDDLKILSPEISQINCFNDFYEISFLVQNNACEVLVAGTNFDVIIENTNNGFSWNSNETLEDDLLRNEFYQFTKEVNIPPSKDDYVIEIVFLADKNLENNWITFPNKIVDPVVAEYENPMNEEDPFLKNEGLFAVDYLTYNENNVLAISSILDQGTIPICGMSEEIFHSSNIGKIATFYVCADLVNLERINLGFDLTQFRNNESIGFPEIEKNSTVLKTTWSTADNNFEQIIAGQSEGETVHYDLELPVSFKGRIQFDFFHNIGDPNFENFFEHDISLFDNLTITGDTINRKIIEGTNFRIQPNPSIGLITIKHPERPQSLKLFNAQGQLLLSRNQTEELCLLNLSDLPDSYYFLTIEYENLGRLTQGIVKISP